VLTIAIVICTVLILVCAAQYPVSILRGRAFALLSQNILTSLLLSLCSLCLCLSYRLSCSSCPVAFQDALAVSRLRLSESFPFFLLTNVLFQLFSILASVVFSDSLLIARDFIGGFLR